MLVKLALVARLFGGRNNLIWSLLGKSLRKRGLSSGLRREVIAICSDAIWTNKRKRKGLQMLLVPARRDYHSRPL